MSATMRAYVAGPLKYAGDFTLFLAPNINGYKRYVAGTFAPTKAVWSRDNRTAGYRLVGEGSRAIRIENRVGGADLNPYLAYTVQIAAGMAGIDEGLELEPEFRGDAYTTEGVRETPGPCARPLRPPTTPPCSARRWATRWWTTTSTPPAGSRHNTTAA